MCALKSRASAVRKDAEITVRNGRLTIKAKRTETKECGYGVVLGARLQHLRALEPTAASLLPRPAMRAARAPKMPDARGWHPFRTSVKTAALQRVQELTRRPRWVVAQRDWRCARILASPTGALSRKRVSKGSGR